MNNKIPPAIGTRTPKLCLLDHESLFAEQQSNLTSPVSSSLLGKARRMSNITSIGDPDLPQLFHDVVLGRGIQPKPDLFGDERIVSVEDVRDLLEVFFDSYGSEDEDGNLAVAWEEIDLVYNGPIFARPNLVLRSQSFVPKCAKYLQLLNLGGLATYGWIEAMIYANHDGFLYNRKDDELNPDALCAKQLWSADVLDRSGYLNKRRFADYDIQDWDEITFEMRWLFGACVKGTIDKFKKFAGVPPSRQREEHLDGQMIFTDAACRIHAGAILQEAVRLIA